jgi:ankyrin repeat protein
MDGVNSFDESAYDFSFIDAQIAKRKRQRKAAAHALPYDAAPIPKKKKKKKGSGARKRPPPSVVSSKSEPVLSTVAQLPDIKARPGTPLDMMSLSKPNTPTTREMAEAEPKVSLLDPAMIEEKLISLPFLNKTEFISMHLKKRGIDLEQKKKDHDAGIHHEAESTVDKEARLKAEKQQLEADEEAERARTIVGARDLIRTMHDFSSSAPSAMGGDSSEAARIDYEQKRKRKSEGGSGTAGAGVIITSTGGAKNQGGVGGGAGAGGGKRRKSSAGRLDAEWLLKKQSPLDPGTARTWARRYERFWLKLPKANRNNIQPTARPIPWLLQLIEEIYDGAYKYERRFGDYPRPKEPCEYANLLPKDVSDTLDQDEYDQPQEPAVVLPWFVYQFVSKRYGLPRVVTQTCHDLLYMLQICEGKFKEVDLFINFFRELYDVDALLFFLHGRHIVQTHLGLTLKLPGKTSGQGTTRKSMPDGAIVLQDHPRLSGATGKQRKQQREAEQRKRERQALKQQALIGQIAGQIAGPPVPPPGAPDAPPWEQGLGANEADQTARVLGEGGGDSSNQKQDKPRALHQQVWMSDWACAMCAKEVLSSPVLGDYFVERHVLESRCMVETETSAAEPRQYLLKQRPMKQKLMLLQDFLELQLDHFLHVPEDIVAELKYKDDGGSLFMIKRLKEAEDAKEEKTQMEAVIKEQHADAMALGALVIKLKRRNRIPGKEGNERTNLFLAQNDEHTKYMELAESERKLHQLEVFMETSWAEVAKKQAEEKALRREKAAKKNDGLTKSVDEVLVRYTAWITRQHRMYLLQMKAANALSKTWKKQLQELMERAAIRLQRAFREKKESARRRVAEEGDLEERRAERKKRLAERRRNDAAVKARREKDHAKHSERMGLKSKRERELEDARKKRNMDMLENHRDEEVERRMNAVNNKLLMRMLRRWSQLVNAERHGRKVERDGHAGRFRRWRGFVTMVKEENKAAKQMQSVFRGKMGRNNFKKMKGDELERERKIKRCLAHVNGHLELWVFEAWTRFTRRSKKVNKLMRTCMNRCERHFWEYWVVFHKACQAEKNKAAIKLQSAWRAKNGRVYAGHVKQENDAAAKMQAGWRGRRGRQKFSEQDKERQAVEKKIRENLHKIMNRNLHQCFNSWYDNCDKMQKAKMLLNKHFARLEHSVFRAWKHRVEKRKKARGRLAGHKYDAATSIQSWLRGCWSRRVTDRLLEERWGSITISRVYRGYCVRFEFFTRVKMYRSARAMQTAWRGRKARAAFHTMRVNFVLDKALKGDYEGLQWCFQYGSAWVVDLHGNNVLHKACEGASKRCVKLCLKWGCDINGYNNQGRTPLHCAAGSPYIGRDALCSYLIDHGAWLEAPDYENNTPLLEATRKGHLDSTEMLLTRQADQGKRDVRGRTPLQVAVDEGNLEVMRALCLAAQNDNRTGNVEGTGTITRPAIWGGTHVNVRDEDGCSPLHDCASNGHVEMARSLLEYGGDIDAQDAEGYTPLIYAVAAEQTEMVNLLIEARADCEGTDNHGRTALHFASNAGVGDEVGGMIQLLADADVNMSPVDNDGDTPLHNAAKTGELGQFTALLKNGANSGTANGDGDQPVHLACELGFVELVEVLIQFEADMDIRNNEGLTPYGCARMNRHDAIVELLDEHYIPAEQLLKMKDAQPVLSTAEWDQRRDRSAIVMQKAGWSELNDPITKTRFYYSHAGHDGDFDRTGVMTNYTWLQPLELTPLYDVNKWERCWSEEEDAAYYTNLITGEVVWKEPPVDEWRLRMVAQEKRKRLHKKMTTVSGEGDVTVTDYLDSHALEFGEIVQTRKEIAAATKIQTSWRRKIAYMWLARLQLQQVCATDIQAAWRRYWGEKRYNMLRIEDRVARMAQRGWRGFKGRQRFLDKYDQLVWERQTRNAVGTAQRAWRGHVGRLGVAWLRAVRDGPSNWVEWQELRKNSTSVRTVGVSTEYLMNGMGCGTMERRLTVFFYADRVTNYCSWYKPQCFIDQDHRDYLDRLELWRTGHLPAERDAAILMQALWRARVQRQYFKAIMKGVRLQQRCEDEYLDKPRDILSLINYCVYLHTFPNDYERARPLYERSMGFMKDRGPDNGFILFNYAIFQAATMADDWGDIVLYIGRAHAAVDMKAGKTHPNSKYCKSSQKLQRFKVRTTHALLVRVLTRTSPVHVAFSALPPWVLQAGGYDPL